MQKAILNKIIAVVVVLLLSLSAFGFATHPVKADAGGTGKYLEIIFKSTNEQAELLKSDCRVTATKVDSGQVFLFNATDILSSVQKVGAGTVLLTALPDLPNGWKFKEFKGDITSRDPETAWYKTVKYGKVEAWFERITYTITPSAGAHGSISPNTPQTVNYGDTPSFTVAADTGYYILDVTVDGSSVNSSLTVGGVYTFPAVTANHNIAASFAIKTYTITPSAGAHGSISPNTPQTVNYGDTITFNIKPDPGFHASTIKVDGYYVTFKQTDTLQYTFENVDSDHTIVVTFSENGLTYIPEGSSVTVFLDPSVSLSFKAVQEGWASSNKLPKFDPADVSVWEIEVMAVFSNGDVIVALRYNQEDVTGDENLLRMYRTDSEYYKGDFNGDGVINGQDVSEISNRINDVPYVYDVKYDLNGDGFLDNADLHTLNSYKDPVWTDITLYVDVENNIIYGITGDFSVFRAR